MITLSKYDPHATARVVFVTEKEYEKILDVQSYLFGYNDIGAVTQTVLGLDISDNFHLVIVDGDVSIRVPDARWANWPRYEHINH